MNGLRNAILTICVVLLLGTAIFAQSSVLTVERRGEFLQVSAPQIRLLSGKALNRLRDGATVHYTLALTAISENSREPLFQMRERFAVSFDLWEEKYTVVQLRSGGRSASRLTTNMAETWLLEAMPVPLGAIPESRSFVIRLECFVDEPENDKEENNNSGLSLAGLIDIFSRRKSDAPLRWEASTGILRLGDFK